MAPDDAHHLHIRVVCSPAPGQWLDASVYLPAGSTAAQAVAASGIAQRMPTEQFDGLTLGLWGRACPPHTPLHDGDRVELTRPLTVDPKEARRLRWRRDRGTRSRRGTAGG